MKYLLLVFLLLSACGYQLRGTGQLPARLQNLVLQSEDAALANELGSLLAAQNIHTQPKASATSQFILHLSAPEQRQDQLRERDGNTHYQISSRMQLKLCQIADNQCRSADIQSQNQFVASSQNPLAGSAQQQQLAKDTRRQLLQQINATLSQLAREF